MRDKMGVPETIPSMTNGLPFQTTFACLSLHLTDRIRLLDFPEVTIDFFRAVIREHWTSGIQYERDYAGSFEFKLRGNPWQGRGNEAITSRRLIQNILHALHARGWVLMLSTDISKKLGDKDTLVFRHQVPEPAPCTWMSVAFSNSDRLRFIDAPVDLVQAMVPMVSPWIQRVDGETESQCYDVKMNGYPWGATGSETMEARRLMLALIKGLEQQGSTIYASINQKMHNSSEASRGETDTWYCCRLVSWRPGMPVFHG